MQSVKRALLAGGVAGRTAALAPEEGEAGPLDLGSFAPSELRVVLRGEALDSVERLVGRDRRAIVVVGPVEGHAASVGVRCSRGPILLPPRIQVTAELEVTDLRCSD